MANLLYVHDYGQWHITTKTPRGGPQSIALCGASHQTQGKKHWASTRHWDGDALMIDGREVHSECLVEVWMQP